MANETQTAPSLWEKVKLPKALLLLFLVAIALGLVIGLVILFIRFLWPVIACGGCLQQALAHLQIQTPKNLPWLQSPQTLPW